MNGGFMNPSQIIIRAYDQEADQSKIIDIWYQASFMAHPFIGADRLQEQRALIQDVYLPQAETWVAEHKGAVLGLISLLDDVVGGLFIDPTVQGQGIGRKLINHAFNLRGALSLEVYLENQKAVGFYQALRFREVARRDVDDLGFPFPNAILRLNS